MEGLRKSLSRLSLAEPNVNISAQQLIKAASLKSGWLRHRRKYFVVFDNIGFVHRFVNRFLKWPNRFALLTTDAVHVFKTEYQNKTERTLNLIDIESIAMCSATETYKWCIKLQPKNVEDQPMLLSAFSERDLEDWYKKIKDTFDKFKNESEDKGEYYAEIKEVEEDLYHEVEPDQNNTKSLITYAGTRDELVELMEMCAIRGNYVIRHSRNDDKAVLSVFNGSCLKEYLIFRDGDRLSLNLKVAFDHIKELTEYYEICTLPKSTTLKLTGPFNTFRPIQ